jgi:hypothetical protein
MIHVATVHHKSPKWIDIQLAYLERNISEPFRVVANLEDVDPSYEKRFDRVVPGLGRHAGKLNLLAAEIAAEGDPDDLMMFLDGDAFPIADPMPVVRNALSTVPLVAVRRDENGHDPQPHPCFCVMRIRDWERLHGDWSMGYAWENDWAGQITDVGANLLATLRREQIPWEPLVRTNRVDLHPLWFAVYGDIVYHHGAGFRDPLAARRAVVEQPSRWKRGETLPGVGLAIRKLASARIKFWTDREVQAGRRLGDEIFTQIENDPEFYRQFL